MVDGARLESVYTATYRGFESLFLRHTLKITDCFLKIIGFFMPARPNSRPNFGNG